MVAPTYRQALERITASGGLFSGRRTLLLREFEIEERPAENIRCALKKKKGPFGSVQYDYFTPQVP